MYIISSDHLPLIDGRYLLLELDTVRDPQSAISKTYYAVIDSLPLLEMSSATAASEAHQHMIQAYKDQQWEYCRSAANGLKGRWNGTIDSFYDSLIDRVDAIMTNCENAAD